MERCIKVLNPEGFSMNGIIWPHSGSIEDPNFSPELNKYGFHVVWEKDFKNLVEGIIPCYLYNQFAPRKNHPTYRDDTTYRVLSVHHEDIYPAIGNIFLSDHRKIRRGTIIWSGNNKYEAIEICKHGLSIARPGKKV